MRKVRLDVGTLEVQSFSTGAAQGGQGTVHAHTGRFPCHTAAGCFSEGAVDGCNTWNDPTCGGGLSCVPSCDPRILCCATDGLNSCAPETFSCP